MKQAQVMIVEDEALVGLDIKYNLTNYGYNVIGISSSGKEAISLAIKEKPEIILMDIRLNGGMDGIETATYLWKRLSVPIIYLTAYSEDNTLLEALKASPYGYLLKPFVPRELHASIQIALHRYELEKKAKQEKLIFLQSNRREKKRLKAEIFDLKINFAEKDEAKKNGRLKYIVNNILERKGFENRLNTQNVFLDRIKELVDNFYYVQNIEDNPINIFSMVEFASMLGYSKEEINRMGSLIIPALIHPDDFPRITEYFQKTIFINKINEIEFRLKHRNNTWKWFSNRCMLIEEHGIKKTINIVREITREKNLEESVFIAHKKLTAISSNPYFGIVILDVDGKVLDINYTLERLSGYTKEEICSQHSTGFTCLREINLICAQFKKLKKGEINSFQVETLAYPKYNGAFWCYMVFSVVHDNEGRLAYITCSIVDISETKVFERFDNAARNTNPRIQSI